MSTIASFDDALDFYPETKTVASKGSRLLAKLQLYWGAMGVANAAAWRYRELVAHGATADAASSQVFAEFYAAR